MDLKQAILKRRSIRKYTDRPIATDAAAELRSLIDECNEKSGLHMQLILGDGKGLSGMRSIILKNANNYLAIVGKDDGNLDELGGYWGEKVVLEATRLGIGSCWFGFGAKKDLIEIAPGEKLLIVAAMGYAAQEAKDRSSKPLEKLCSIPSGVEAPDWFIAGVKAAQLAPTALNKQNFKFTLINGDSVMAESLGGVFSRVGLGIVKRHFEIGASPQSFSWA
jgi:nitroreductase